MENKEFKLDFVGVGAPRCATTWIYECLKEHPDICMSLAKEPHFFSVKYNPRYRVKTVEEYIHLFKYCQPGQIKGEYSNLYFIDEEALKRIKKHNPEIKILLSLRNPFDWLCSSYKFLVNLKQLPRGISLKEAMKINPLIFEIPLYAKHLERIYKIFKKDRVLILIYEDIRNNPSDAVQKIYKFLSVDPNFKPKVSELIINKSEGVWVNKLHNELTHLFSKSKNFLPQRLYLKIKNLYHNRIRYLFFKIETRFVRERKINVNNLPINDDFRKELKSIFYQEVQKLEKLIQRDLSFWLKDV